MITGIVLSQASTAQDRKPPVRREIVSPSAPVARISDAKSTQRPRVAEVQFDGSQLTVLGGGSTLPELLKAVLAKTGAVVTGLQLLGRERIFAEYGPASPRVILTRLLSDTGYSFVLVGVSGNAESVAQLVILPKPRSPSDKTESESAERTSDPADEADTEQAADPSPAPVAPVLPVSDPAPAPGLAVNSQSDPVAAPDGEKKITVCGIEYYPSQLGTIRIPQHCGAGYTPSPSIPPATNRQ